MATRTTSRTSSWRSTMPCYALPQASPGSDATSRALWLRSLVLVSGDVDLGLALDPLRILALERDDEVALGLVDVRRIQVGAVRRAVAVVPVAGHGAGRILDRRGELDGE